jgi:uncharacterized protein (DUF433 family)
MNWKVRIVIDPNVLVGKPVIKGTRIAVEFIVELLAEGWTHEQILKNYSHLTTEDIQAALHYASNMMKQEKLYPLTVWAMATFLAHENVPGDAVEAARQRGIDLAWLKETGLAYAWRCQHHWYGEESYRCLRTLKTAYGGMKR